EHVRTFGDVSQALREFYERTVGRTVSDADVPEADLRAWFARHLITQAGTRGTVFRGPEATEGIPNRAIDLLENQHLIRAELRAGARWYELTHDRFIRPIQASNEVWRQRVKLLQLQGQFQIRWRRFGAIAAIILAILGVVIFDQYRTSRQIESHELAARSLTQLTSDPEESLCLAIKAGELERSTADQPMIDDALRQALRESRGRSILTNNAGQRWLTSAAFRPDGQQVIAVGLDVSSKDTIVRLWDVPSGKVTDRRAAGNEVLGATFSGPTPMLIAMSAANGTAHVLDATTGNQLASLQGTPGGISRASFSADGTLVATAGLDGVARIWNTTTGALLAQLRNREVSLQSVAFSPDGTRVVSGEADGKAVIWHIRSTKAVVTLTGHADAVLDAVFSADEKYVLTASRDRTLRIWDASTGSTLIELRGHTAPVTSAAFSP